MRRHKRVYARLRRAMALAKRCFAEPGPRFVRGASNRDPGSAAHHHSASKTRVNALMAKSGALRSIRGTPIRRSPHNPVIPRRSPQSGEPRRIGHMRLRPSFEMPRKRAALRMTARCAAPARGALARSRKAVDSPSVFPAARAPRNRAAPAEAVRRRPSGYAGQAGVAGWTGPPCLTITRRSQGPWAQAAPR
jgi:hypothetical protein